MGPTCTFIPTYKVIKLKQFLLLSSCIKENLSRNLFLLHQQDPSVPSLIVPYLGTSPSELCLTLPREP